MTNALERIQKSRNLPQQIEALEGLLQTANQQISKLEKEVAAMGKALKRHLQQHPQPAMSQHPISQGDQDMLSATEYQEFLRVKKLMSQRQEEERRRIRLSEEQKKRIEEMIRRTEAAALKRPDSLYWEDYFAMDCMEELRKRKQTVEQVDWREVESGVAAGLLRDGATVQDVAEILHEKGVGAALDPAAPPDGQTAGKRLALEYLKNLAASDPGLQDAVEQAEKRMEDEARQAATASPAQKNISAPRPDAA